VNVVSVDSIVLYGRKKDAPTAPKSENEDRFWFQTAEQVEFRANITPDNQTVRSAINDKFKWTLDPVAGVTGNNWAPVPDWGDGTHAKGIGTSGTRIKFFLKVLPSGNVGFGEKTLSLTVEGTNISKTAKLRLFFQRTGKKHPNPGQNQTANWYYYWSQEGNPAVCEFSRDAQNTKYAKYWASGTSYGKYESGEGPNGTIYLSDKVATGDKIEGWEYNFPEGHQPQNGIVAFELDPENAPEFANLSYAHEATHRTLHLLGPLGNGTGPQDDQDQDGVPNGWEDAVAGMDKTKSNTFGNAFKVSAGSAASRDEEFYCVLGGAFKYGRFVAPGESVAAENYHGESPSAANNGNDWAENGTQWTTNLQ